MKQHTGVEASQNQGCVNGTIGQVLRAFAYGLLLEVERGVIRLNPRNKWLSDDGRNRVVTASDVDVRKAQDMTLHAGVLAKEDYRPEGWGETALTHFSSRDQLCCIGDVHASCFGLILE